MELALRPSATAAVAMTAASPIAVTPVAPPPVALQERAVQLTTSAVGDLARWSHE